MLNGEQMEEILAPIMEESKAEKELLIFAVKNTSMFKVGFDGGGVLQEELSGWFTTPNKAQEAINYYLERRDGKRN